ncbi:epoxyqueuosine reductase [Candidatus Bathyarchaeota archaeon]|nr:MAG: epoxyqueuosine reductase [Candidatus Bathyarchaeota archaeon]
MHSDQLHGYALLYRKETMSDEVRLLSDLKNDLERFVKGLGAYAMRVADPKDFENAILGCHPRNFLKNCNSVVVFGIYVGLDYYRSIQLENKTIGENRIMHIFRDWVQYRVFEFLQERGCHAVVPTGLFDREKLIHRLSLKLVAYEAGLGVYGRCGIIITPEYGPRVNFGAVLTDVMLEPDEKLTNFNPCLDCRLCVNVCPPKTIREDLSPPTSHNRDRCVNFVLKLRGRTDDNRFLCGYCYNNCPVGKTDKPGFRLSKYRNLLDLSVQERERLISVCVREVAT